MTNQFQLVPRLQVNRSSRNCRRLINVIWDEVAQSNLVFACDNAKTFTRLHLMNDLLRTGYPGGIARCRRFAVPGYRRRIDYYVGIEVFRFVMSVYFPFVFDEGVGVFRRNPKFVRSFVSGNYVPFILWIQFLSFAIGMSIVLAICSKCSLELTMNVSIRSETSNCSGTSRCSL